MTKNDKKISAHQKLLLFMNLSLWQQVFILIKLFVWLLIIGCCIQYGLQKYGYTINILNSVIWIFAVFVLFCCDLPQKIEIIPEKDMSVKSQLIRVFKMMLNIVLYIIYFGIAFFVAAIPPVYALKFRVFDADVFWVVCFIYSIICFALIVWLILWKYKDRLFFTFPEIQIKNKHILNIENSDFVLIETNQKKIEFWVADSKRKRIKIGDILVFQNMDNIEKNIYTEVTMLYFADNPAQLTSEVDIQKTGYDNIHEALRFLNENYTAKQQKKFGLIGIEFSLETVVK